MRVGGSLSCGDHWPSSRRGPSGSGARQQFDNSGSEGRRMTKVAQLKPASKMNCWSWARLGGKAAEFSMKTIIIFARQKWREIALWVLFLIGLLLLLVGEVPLGVLALWASLSLKIGIVNRDVKRTALYAVNSKHCSATLECVLFVDEICRHSSIENWYHFLRGKGQLSEVTVDDWRTIIADRLWCAGVESGVAAMRLNVSLNHERDSRALVFKASVKGDGEILIGDSPSSTIVFSETINVGDLFQSDDSRILSEKRDLVVFAWIVNGWLRVGIGPWATKEESLACDRDNPIVAGRFTHVSTICKFPVMYCHTAFLFSPRVMNMDGRMLDEHKNALSKRSRKEEWMPAWKSAQSDFGKYCLIYDALVGGWFDRESFWAVAAEFDDSLKKYCKHIGVDGSDARYDLYYELRRNIVATPEYYMNCRYSRLTMNSRTPFSMKSPTVLDYREDRDG
jgi:hypothetical protein